MEAGESTQLALQGDGKFEFKKVFGPGLTGKSGPECEKFESVAERRPNFLQRRQDELE